MRYLASALLVATLLVVPLETKADFGPKPLSNFHFYLTYQTSNLFQNSIIQGQTVDCNNDKCSSPGVVEDIECKHTSCDSIYAFHTYSNLMLKLIFSDGKTRESNIVHLDLNNPQTRISYNVVVRDNDLRILTSANKTSLGTLEGYTPAIFLALLKTLFWELLVVGLFAVIVKKLRHLSLFYTAVAANIVSVPTLWWIVLSLVGRYYFPKLILISESGVVLFEALILHFFNKKYLPFWLALILSIVMNTASYFLGNYGPF